MRFNFPFNLIGKSINHANHGAYSNPGTQAGTQNKDFGTVPQSDVTKKFVSVMAQANVATSKIFNSTAKNIKSK